MVKPYISLDDWHWKYVGGSRCQGKHFLAIFDDREKGDWMECPLHFL